MEGIGEKCIIKEETIIKEEAIIKEELDLDAWESTQEEETNQVINSGSRIDMRENPGNERRAKNAGKAYMNRQGQLVPARTIKNLCTISSRQPCHLDCARRLIPERNRERIFQYFWNLPDRFKKYEFICRHVRLIQPRKRKSNPLTSKTRNYSRSYFLPLDGKLVKVCRTSFTATLDVNEQWLSTAFKKFGHLSSGLESEEGSDLELESIDQNSTEEFETKFFVDEPDPLDIQQAKDPGKDIFDPDESAIKMELDLYVQSERDKLERMRKLAAERQQRYKARKRLEKIDSNEITASTDVIAAPTDAISAWKSAMEVLIYEKNSSEQDKQDRKRKLAAERQKRYKAKKRLEKNNLDAIIATENGMTGTNGGESSVQDKQARKRKLAAERQKRYKARKRLGRTNSDAKTVQEFSSQETSSQDIADQSGRGMDDFQVKTKRRKAIEAGIPYVRCDGSIHPGRHVKKGCDDLCYYNCRTVSEKQRQKIFLDFWSINDRSEKYAYISRLVEVSEAKTKIPSRRKLSRKYFFEINGEFRRVCYLMFTATLDINHAWIRLAVKHAGARVYVSVDDIEDDEIGPIL